ncbi:MAG: ABC transporter permease [Pilosibacter sp.]
MTRSCVSRISSSAVPSLLLSITIVSALGPSIFNLMLAIAISSVPGYARIVRASVLTVKDQEFVEAAKCIGANNFEIISSHILPNCMAPIIVQVSLKAASGDPFHIRRLSFLEASA